MEREVEQRGIIVEQDEGLAMWLISLLATVGIESDRAHGVDDAVALFSERNYQVVIVEEAVDGGKGTQICQKAREAGAMTVLLGDEVSSQQGQADWVIPRPLNAERIQAAIERAARGEGPDPESMPASAESPADGKVENGPAVNKAEDAAQVEKTEAGPAEETSGSVNVEPPKADVSPTPLSVDEAPAGGDDLSAAGAAHQEQHAEDAVGASQPTESQESSSELEAAALLQAEKAADASPEAGIDSSEASAAEEDRHVGADDATLSDESKDEAHREDLKVQEVDPSPSENGGEAVSPVDPIWSAAAQERREIARRAMSEGRINVAAIEFEAAAALSDKDPLSLLWANWARYLSLKETVCAAAGLRREIVRFARALKTTEAHLIEAEVAQDFGDLEAAERAALAVLQDEQENQRARVMLEELEGTARSDE